jgi:hypothetical protein
MVWLSRRDRSRRYNQTIESPIQSQSLDQQFSSNILQVLAGRSLVEISAKSQQLSGEILSFMVRVKAIPKEFHIKSFVCWIWIVDRYNMPIGMCKIMIPKMYASRSLSKRQVIV